MGYYGLESGSVQRGSGKVISQRCTRIAFRVSEFVIGCGCLAGSIVLGVHLVGSAKELHREIEQTPSPMSNVTLGPVSDSLKKNVTEYALGVIATAATGLGLCVDAIQPGFGKYVFGGVLCLPCAGVAACAAVICDENLGCCPDECSSGELEESRRERV